MTLYEQKAAKESELVALKDAIESGDETAIKEGAEIAEALEAINASIAEAETAKAALEAIGTDEGSETPMEETPKSLGEFAVKSFGEMHRGGAINVVAPGYKANTDISVTTPVTEYDRKPNDFTLYNPSIEDLLAHETISGNSLTYYVMSPSLDGSPDGVAEGAAKPQVHIPYEAVTAELYKQAAYLKESDELVEDAPWLKTAIDNRLVIELERTIRAFLTNSLLTYNGLMTDDWAQGATPAGIADKVLETAMTIEQGTGHKCNGVLMGPDVYAALRTGKDGDQRYYGGGYWGEQAVSTLWGMPVVVDSDLSGTIIVGDFTGASKISNTSGVQVAMTNANEDDFIHNVVTVRAEQRVGLAVRQPYAFCILTEATSS